MIEIDIFLSNQYKFSLGWVTFYRTCPQSQYLCVIFLCHPYSLSAVDFFRSAGGGEGRRFEYMSDIKSSLILTPSLTYHPRLLHSKTWRRMLDITKCRAPATIYIRLVSCNDSKTPRSCNASLCSTNVVYINLYILNNGKT